MEHRVVFVHRILVNLEKTLSAPVLCCHVLCDVAQLALELFIKRCWMAKDSGLWQGEQCVQRHGERSDHDGEQRHSGQSFRQDQEGCWNHGLSRISPTHSSTGGPVAVVCMRTASGVRAGVARLAYANSYHFCRECCQRIIWQLEEKQSSFLPMLKLLAAVAGAGVVFAGAAQAIPLTARTVCVNCIGPRSDVLNPLSGTNDTPVPGGLIAGSGYTRDELQAGLTKGYSVDVVAVADFLYSDKGVQFLKDSIGQNNYTPYYSQQNALQAVRSAIILDSVDGQLSGFGMMNLLPVDERLQGAMNVCNVDASNVQRKTSLLSWYVNTPACIAAYTQQAQTAAPASAPVRGLW